jgi:hypothetical protein
MAKTTLLSRAARGLGAGVIGTTTMTAWQGVSAKLQGSSADGNDSKPADPWAEAPAPAKVGRLILHAFGYDAPANKIGLLTNIMHWGYGITWGAVYGAVMGEAVHERPLARGLAFATSLWVMSYIELVPLGIYEPPWDYSPQVLAFDLSYHLAYGIGLGLSGAVVEP